MPGSSSWTPYAPQGVKGFDDDDNDDDSYRSETDGRSWETRCELSHCSVEGKDKPPHYDLEAANSPLAI